MSEPTATSRVEATRRLGRRLGIALFALLLSSFTLVCSFQIVRDVWFPSEGPAVGSCRGGIRSLVSAVERARNAAAAENGDERAALSRFRAKLAPEWQSLPAVEHACEKDQQARDALRDVVELRFAEEHAVRYEAVALARLRRRVQALDPGLRAPADPR
ncbi:MAG TPA: hypothetical protein VK524_20635 [Polyangiaceae bacterium]|nr:hypothetical protein [Polyangiaceae bacterium]